MVAMGRPAVPARTNKLGGNQTAQILQILSTRPSFCGVRQDGTGGLGIASLLFMVSVRWMLANEFQIPIPYTPLPSR
jgi:hypothetical protein